MATNGATRAGARLQPGWRWLAPFTMTVLVLTAIPAAARPLPGTIVLTGAHSAEGIAGGRGSTFYAGDAFAGDIYRGDLERGTAELFIKAPVTPMGPERQALGMKFDYSNALLFVAGGFTGKVYVYDTTTGATVSTYTSPLPGAIMNDVALTQDSAWITDSAHAQLLRIPVGPHGSLGALQTLDLSGPAANTSSQFNLNGIVATPNGSTLIVAHSGTGQLYTVNPTTGTSALIAGVSVPNVDGILLEGPRLWAVQNANNQVSTIRLQSDLSSGVVEKVITDSRFEFPTTVAKHGDELAVVNAKLDTGFPPTAGQYEIVLVDR